MASTMNLSREPIYMVVHISFGLDVGGQEKLLVEFARHATRRRFDLEFVSVSRIEGRAGLMTSTRWAGR